MNGKLNDHPLAELIREISSKGFSGTLRLEHERAKAVVYFENGQLIFAASNLRTLRLREYLKKRALVSETDLAGFADNCPDLHLARTLSAHGTLRQEDIDALLSTIVADTLRVALLWTEGSWDFNERARLDEQVRVTVDTSNLLREAAQRMPLTFVENRLRNPGETISRASGIATATNLLPAESFILSRLDAPIKLEELVASSGQGDLDANRIIYGLALGGLIKREYWQNAFRTDPARTTRELSVVDTGPTKVAVEGEPPAGRWTSPGEEPDLDAFLERMRHASSYYEVIDLPPIAEPTEIKNAYYALARLYHPDRFHLKSGTPLHNEISSAFARITQAYETLTDPNSRATYDQTLERSKKFAADAPKADKVGFVADSTDELGSETDDATTELGSAEYNFREGFGALQQGRNDAAMSHLATASRLAPHEARYRAYYGRVLATKEKTRRLAESEIQAAVKLEPANATYRTMLAELYFELKFPRRAQTELDQALALDPNNTSAQALLRKLENSRKVG
ncbi:MAG TPA: hypothetical protein DHU55_15740 [Blastocatellia bacterium]|jgi:curved DNA-binding protein CbpA|nr:hypothetical protein [Blastocatellia bacterium]HAF25482.1 hypothetical protein [Blastocatellia bacterium]HCX31197.1 hypothetical protein [Blastocatellia bacterium]